MSVRVDLHIHTEESVCATFAYDELKAKINSLRLKVVTITDHGSAKTCLKLKKELKETLVVPGIEVTTNEGDFIVFSKDEAYIKSLSRFAGSLERLVRDEETVVIWVHPKIPHRFSWKEPFPERALVEKILSNIDGLEMFNGHLLEMTALGFVMPLYYKNLVDMANNKKVALTAGSDTHDGRAFMKCWTEIESEINSVADFIGAIKARRTKPTFNPKFYGLNPRTLLAGSKP